MPKRGMPEIRRPQLIEATKAAIGEVGLHKASITVIAGYAGTAPAIISHYFGDKDGLLEATMRSVLKDLGKAVSIRLAGLDQADVYQRLMAIVDGNFDDRQLDSKVVKTWLTFWCYAMHKPNLFRLQQVNNKRLLSHLRLELKKILPAKEAEYRAEGIAALIDGIWLRGGLSPEGIDKARVRQLIDDYLRAFLPQERL